MKISSLIHLALFLLVPAAVWAQGAPAAPAEEDPQVWVGRLADPDTRDTARDKLRDLGPAAVPILTKALKGTDPVVRSEAAFVLGRIGIKEAVPALVEALSDADPRVRANAAYALGELAEAKALAPLIKALSDADANVRANACFALGHVGDPKAAPELVKALADPDENVRNFAASALGTTKEPKALPALAWSALNDASSGVRALAAASMGTLGDKHACDTLVGLLEDKEYVVRARAIESLVLLVKDRRGYEARETEAQRAAAVGRWKAWLAKQKLAPVKPREPVDVYETWAGKPKPPAEPGPDTPDASLVPGAAFTIAPVSAKRPAEAPATAAAAILAMRKAVEINPKDAVSLNELGRALEAQGDAAEAEKMYRRSDVSAARFNLAELLFRQGKVAEPLKLYSDLSAAEAAPTLPDGVNPALIALRLGSCQRRMGKLDVAKGLLAKAAEGAKAPAFLREAARQLAAMREFAAAKDLLVRAYELTAGDPETAWALAMFLLHVPDDAVKDAKKAAVYAEVAWTAKPAEERYVSTMAEAKWALGEKEKAAALLEEALKKSASEALKKQLEEYRKSLVAPGEKAEEATGEKRLTAQP